MATILAILRNSFDPLRWTGPIFDKELRVSSRRRRNYVLRFMYLLGMLLFIWFVWKQTVDFSHTTNVIAYMSSAGIELTSAIIWFQFIVLQLVAVSMVSTTIRDELASQTLGVLLTTPISSFQIVLGKLMSKLLQLFALLALSLPVLAIIRVFGGVQWNYIVAALCITLTTLVFDAAVCMFISVSNRKSYQVLAGAVSVLVLFYAIIPWTLAILWMDLGLSTAWLEMILGYINPFFVLGLVTQSALYGGAAPYGSFNTFWLIHCGITLGVAVGLMLVTTVRVRKAALRQMVGEPPRSLFKRRKKGADIDALHADENRIRRVKGRPIVWKELREPLVRARTLWQKMILVFVVLFMIVFYGYAGYRDWFEDEAFHLIFVVIYMIMGMFATAVGGAAAITKERETRSWPILLMTPLEDGSILFGKVVGTIRRYLPIWLFLIGHLIFFTGFGYIHPAALILMPLIIFNGLIYSVLSGLCFSACFRKTALALILTLVFALGWMIFLPMMCAMGDAEELAEFLVSGNPIVQAGMVMDATSGDRLAHYPWKRLDFNWPMSHDVNVNETLAIILGFTLANLIISTIFLAVIRGNLRRKLFSK